MSALSIFLIYSVILLVILGGIVSILRKRSFDIKVIVLIVLSIIAVIGGMVLNFPEFLMGHSATTKNLIVTFTYVAIWSVVLGVSIRIKSRGLIKYSSLFWLITLLLSVLTAYVNISDISADWAIPFVILFIGQWYGIKFFVGSFLTVSIIIVLISFIMVTTAVISLKQIKRA